MQSHENPISQHSWWGLMNVKRKSTRKEKMTSRMKSFSSVPQGFWVRSQPFACLEKSKRLFLPPTSQHCPLACWHMPVLLRTKVPGHLPIWGTDGWPWMLRLHHQVNCSARSSTGISTISLVIFSFESWIPQSYLRESAPLKSSYCWYFDTSPWTSNVLNGISNGKSFPESFQFTLPIFFRGITIYSLKVAIGLRNVLLK